MHEGRPLIVNATAVLQQFTEISPRGPVYKGQVVFGRQHNIHLDAAQGCGIEDGKQGAIGDKIGGHDAQPAAGTTDGTENDPAQLFKIFVGSGADPATEGRTVGQWLWIADWRWNIAGGKMPVFHESFQHLPHRRTFDAKVHVYSLKVA